jgi:hypothetical protein
VSNDRVLFQTLQGRKKANTRQRVKPRSKGRSFFIKQSFIAGLFAIERRTLESKQQ